MMARQKFRGSPANLDALCRRFSIDNSSRTYHGALLDSQLLAEVYLELLGGRQQGLAITETVTSTGENIGLASEKVYRAPRVFSPSEEELSLHEEMIGKLKNPLWKGQA